MKLKQVIKILRGFLKAMREDHVGAYAAQSAYFIMLSFIPFIILFLSLLQYTNITKSDIYSLTQALLPNSMDAFVINIINEVYSKTFVTISLSAIVVVWSAGKGFLALIRGMNTVYHVEEQSNYFWLRIRSAIYTLIFVASIVLSLVVLVFGNSIHKFLMEYLPLMAVISGLIIKLKDIAALVFLIMFFIIMYKFIPNRKASFFSQVPGGFFAAVCWYIFSFGFSVYVNYSPGISNMYGSLTTLVLIMLWLYFCMYIILLGAEINSYFEKQFQMIKEYRKRLRENTRDIVR